MKAKEGAEVDDECPPLSGDLFQMGNLVEAEQSSSDNLDFDLSYGGLIVATGVLLAKPVILALFWCVVLSLYETKKLYFQNSMPHIYNLEHILINKCDP